MLEFAYLLCFFEDDESLNLDANNGSSDDEDIFNEIDDEAEISNVKNDNMNGNASDSEEEMDYSD